MEAVNNIRPMVSRALCFAICLLAPKLLFAQGCAQCYTQAAGSGSRMIQALKSGITVLVVPPMLICVGISWMAYKKRNQFNEDAYDASAEKHL